MKQKCQLQIGVTQYKNAATPLSTSGINTTSQHEVYNFVIIKLYTSFESAVVLMPEVLNGMAAFLYCVTSI